MLDGFAAQRDLRRVVFETLLDAVEDRLVLPATDASLFPCGAFALDRTRLAGVRDARSMATTSKQPRVVGYNVQSVVETKHHLIVAHEVTNHGYDRDALSMMARAAKDVMASDTIEAVADKGYYSGEEIVAAEQAGVAVTVSKPNTSNSGAAGRFDKADFVYVSDQDIYICPAGKRLTYHMTSELDGKMMRSSGSVSETCVSPVVSMRLSTARSVSASFL